MPPRPEESASPVEGAPAQSGFFGQAPGDSTRAMQADLGALLCAIALHIWGGAGAATSLFDLSTFSGLVRSAVITRLEASIDIEPEEVEPEEEEPEPEPEEEPEPEPEPLEPEESPEDIPQAEEVVEPEAVPAAAEAGKVLTSEPDPNEPLDLTDQGFVTGNGSFRGGVTASDGTAKKAVRNVKARGDGLEGARGKSEGAKGTRPPAKDLSRPAGLPPGANWNSCGFPPEADAEQINQARVRVVVIVGTDGRPTSVSVLSDPGYGFGRIARNCAMRFKYPVGLDKFGNPAPKATLPFAITFTR